MHEPDPRIISAARAGDLAAFEQLVRAYQADVWRLSLHLMRDPDLAADVSQDAFVRAYRFLGRYRGDSKFSTWLVTIVRNCAHDELRRTGRRRKLSQRMESQPRPAVSDATVGVEVREELARLPIELREPVVMIDVFGMSYDETSAVLGVAVGTVKSRVHRARNMLAKALGERLERRDEA